MALISRRLFLYFLLIFLIVLLVVGISGSAFGFLLCFGVSSRLANIAKISLVLQTSKQTKQETNICA